MGSFSKQFKSFFDQNKNSIQFDDSLLNKLSKLQLSIDKTIKNEDLSFISNDLEAFFKEIENRLKKNLEKSIVNTKKIIIYSDGACRGNPGPGGLGYIVLGEDYNTLYEYKEFHKLTTNNRMELKAALESLKYVKNKIGENGENEVLNLEIELHSDSKYVVDGLKSWMHGWKKRGWKKSDKSAPENLEIWKELYEVTNMFKNLSFHWVKGHSGNKYNDRCDELANQAIDEDSL